MIENLDEPVAKRNGSENLLTRRAALLGISLGVAGSSLPAPAQSEPLPTREDLEDYFLFLWSEHRRVAEELGIDVFDHVTLHNRGGRVRYEEACPSPASERALRVLAQTGFTA
ncbi:hypothetical protein [Sinorhizobium meliloti]|uniref:hypothetical protein n=1 Tax=Rhizobium meliloti TaxID=382 RepID=UPI0012BB7FB2|nr:hypothetical protein [Sinorhizobium meliloti]UFX07269.1 hypothetical protein SmelRRI128_12430 [Sinorhizobium meliloti]